MYSTETSLFGIGLAGIAWIIYQCVTGRFIYKRKTIRREDNPIHFWCAMGFESLLAVAGLTWGLGFKPLAVVVSGAVELTALVLFLVSILKSIRNTVKLRRARYRLDR